MRLESMLRELRFAVRRLGKRPGLTAVSILCLALGIGATAALFSLFDQIAIRRLPVRDPDRLIILDAPGPTTGRIEMSSDFSQPFSHPMFEDLAAGSTVTAGMAARYRLSVGMSYRGETTRVPAVLVSGGYFPLLGVPAAAGRVLAPADDEIGVSAPVVVLSHAAWRRRFGGDRAIVGREIAINGQPMTVVGVAAAGFRGLQVGYAPDLFLPMAQKPVATPLWNDLENRRSMWLNIVARLAPGVSLESAKAQLDGVYRGILAGEAERSSWPGWFVERFVSKHLEVLPGSRGRSDLRGDADRRLAALVAIVALALLVTCFNLANLLAARAMERGKETSVRIALGARRGRIVGELFAESAVLAAAGGLLGVGLAPVLLATIVRLLPGQGVAEAFSAAPDPMILGIGALLAAGTAVIIGLLPATETLRADLMSRLREAGGTPGRRSLLGRRVLVGAQVAFSVTVLVGALLFTRSLHRLLAVDPGFAIDHLLTLSVDPSLAGRSPEAAADEVGRLRDAFAGLPGVRGVAVAGEPLLTGEVNQNSVGVEGYDAAEGEDMSPRFNEVAPGFFSALGLAIRSGRGFSARDDARSRAVAVINQVMAERYFRGRNPVGLHLYRGHAKLPVEIVGVVQDGVAASLREEVPRMVYVPLAQTYGGGGVTFYLRTSGETSSLPPAVREVARRVDPQLPLFDLSTMDAQVASALFADRAAMIVSVSFAVLITLLAGLGLYGVLAYSVQQRHRELGVRAALGADRRGLARAVLREALRPVATGVLIGLLAALVASRPLAAVLFEVRPTDPASFVVVPVLLALTALIAGAGPAWRAARIDPMKALRDE